MFPHYLNVSKNAIIDRVDRLTPGAIDKAAHLYNVLHKWNGGEALKNDKLCEINAFIYIVLKNPKLLLESPLRQKKRLQKIKEIM